MLTNVKLTFKDNNVIWLWNVAETATSPGKDGQLRYYFTTVDDVSLYTPVGTLKSIEHIMIES